MMSYRNDTKRVPRADLRPDCGIRLADTVWVRRRLPVLPEARPPPDGRPLSRTLRRA